MSSQGDLPINIPYTDQQVTENILPLLIGIYFSFALFGIGLFQFWTLANLLVQSTVNEKWNWAVLGGLLLLDVTDQIIKAIFFEATIRGIAVRGLAAAFYPTTPVILGVALFGGLIPFAVHLIYIKRLHRISRTWKYRYVVWVILLLCFITSVAATVFAILSGRVGLRPAIEYFPDIKNIPVPWLAGDVAVDGALCFLLSAYLFSQRTEFKNTNRLLGRWIAVTLETGLLPAGFALADLLLALYHPDKPYHFAINFVLSKVYINAVLALFHTIMTSRMSPKISQNTNPPMSPRYVSSDGVTTTNTSGSISTNHRIQLESTQSAREIRSFRREELATASSSKLDNMSISDKEKYYS